MRIGELASTTGVPPRILRYYQEQGLISPRRLDNGYREYDECLIDRVKKIRELIDTPAPTSGNGESQTAQNTSVAASDDPQRRFPALPILRTDARHGCSRALDVAQRAQTQFDGVGRKRNGKGNCSNDFRICSAIASGIVDVKLRTGTVQVGGREIGNHQRQFAPLRCEPVLSPQHLSHRAIGRKQAWSVRAHHPVYTGKWGLECVPIPSARRFWNTVVLWVEGER